MYDNQHPAPVLAPSQPVRAGCWRILVGEDVTRLDKRARKNAEAVYVDFPAWAPIAGGEEAKLA
jgi:hypothetical protein